MVPVMQTKVVVKKENGEQVRRGNCFAACIASILELPIEEVPNVEVLFDIKAGYWSEVMLTFLNSKGWELCTDERYKCFHKEILYESYGEDMYHKLRQELADKYYLVSGKSQRGVYHICIYQNGKLKHDPHPTKEGLVTVEMFETLEKRN